MATVPASSTLRADNPAVGFYERIGMEILS
jgi:hypothetical protein